MRKSVLFALLLSLVAMPAGSVPAADDKKAEPPDEKALVEAMMKAGQPGEPHKRLEALAGSWEATVKMWMDPAKEPTESKATSEAKMIMGGRYLEEKVTGEFGGMKFQGQSTTGYDNLQKKYVSTWIDNFGTGIMVTEGKYDADKKTFTYTGEETDPLTAKKGKMKSVLHLIDKDKFEVDMFKLEGDKEVKSMHIDYTRKKK